MDPSAFKHAYLAALAQQDIDRVLSEGLNTAPSWSGDESLTLFLELPSLVDKRNTCLRANRDPEHARLLDRRASIEARRSLARIVQTYKLKFIGDIGDMDLYDTEAEAIDGRLRELGLPEPLYGDKRSEELLKFARQLLLRIDENTTQERIASARCMLEDDYQQTCFDLPVPVLQIVLRGWEPDLSFLEEAGLDAPGDYFEQLRRKRPDACLPFVADRLRAHDVNKCWETVHDFLPHARGHRSTLEEWHEVLLGRASEDADTEDREFERIAEHVRTRADLAHPLALLEDYLSQDRPDAEALHLAQHELRLAGPRIEIARAALDRLLERDGKLLNPRMPPVVSGLLHDDALTIALDYLAIHGIGRPSPQTTCAMLTLCLQRHIARALCAGDVPGKWTKVVHELGLGGLLRLISGEHISDMDGARVSHDLNQRDLKELQDVVRIRNKAHHAPMELQPGDARSVYRLLFENAELLKKLKGARLFRK